MKRAHSRLLKIATAFTLLFSPFSNVVTATTTTTAPSPVLTDAATKFVPYENSDGIIYYDPANEPGKSPDEVDFTSGNDKGVGDKPSFYVYGDDSNLYFRMRILGDPYDRKGGFLSTVWNVDLLIDGEHKATMGLDGKSPHVDYLFVTNPLKTNVIEVSKTTTPGGSVVPNTSIVPAENGHYFLDFKIPYTKIEQIVPGINKATPNVSFKFNTSKSANLRVINKDEMDTAGTGAKVKLAPFGIYKPSIAFTDVTTYQNANPTIAGTTTNAANGSSIALFVNGKTFAGTVTNGSWSIATDLPVGTYDATATVTNEKGNKATAKKSVKVGTLISIDGPSVEKVYKFPSIIKGKFVNTTGGSKKVEFTIKKLISNVEQTVTSYNNIQADSTAQTWEKTGVVLPASHGIGTYPIVAVEDTSGSNLPTASKTIIVIAPPTITTPVLENGQLVVKGTAEKGETVDVYIDGVFYKSVVADPTTGEWKIEVDKLLSTGTHSFQAKAKDDNGAEGVSSVVNYQVTAISVSIANGEQTVTNDPTPIIYGKTSVSNSGKVKLSIDGGTDVVVNVLDGKWSYPVPATSPLSEGEHTVRAIAVEGSLVSEPDTQDLTVDTVTTVAITDPTNQEVKNTKTITFTGTGEVGGIVTLKIDNLEEVIIPLDNSNTWSYTPNPELEYGAHTVTVKGMDELGNTKKLDGTEAIVSHEFLIPDPTKPVASDDTVYTLKDNSKTGTLQVTDLNAPLSYSVTTTPTKGTVTIDSKGQWTYVPDSGVTGTDTFVVQVENALDNTDEATVTVHIVDLAVEIDSVLARTVNHKPTFTGKTVQTPNSELTVKITKKDGTEVSEEVVLTDEQGNWSYTSPTLLPAGDYKVIATITDAILQESKVDQEDFSVYDANYEISLTANPEKVIADGYSTVELTAALTDQNVVEPLNGVENEWVSFTTPEGHFVAKQGQTVSLDGKTITAKTDSLGFAKVELVTPSYFNETASKTVKVEASVSNEEKGLQATDDFLLTFMPAVVTGQVVNALTGEVIPNATIQVEKVIDEETTFTYTGVTDANGFYRFPVKKGNTTYDVVITANVMVDGVEVPVTFTQKVKVDPVTGTTVETQKADHVVSGKVLVRNSKTGQVQTLANALGNVSVVAEVKNPAPGMTVAPKSTGEYVVTGGVSGETYDVIFSVKDLNSNKLLAGKKVTITVPDNGQATILPILIDPYGEITDKDTGAVVPGADVKLYWADTQRNKELGRTAHALVDLPTLAGFAPNNNANPQTSSVAGLYAWMVYPQGDYYIVATKEGYKEYSSLTEARDVAVKPGEDSFVENGIITVGSTIVQYDFEMEKTSLSVTIDGGQKLTTPDRTPVITGEGTGATTGKVKVTLKDKNGNIITTTDVTLVNGKWTLPVQVTLEPGEYTVEAEVKDTTNNRTASVTKMLTIEKVELKIELTATPNSIVGDGKTEVTLKAIMKDRNGNPLVGEKVSFATEAGTLKATEAITNDKGEVVVTLIAPDLFGNTVTLTKNVTASVNNPDNGLVAQDVVSIYFVPAKVTGQVIDATTNMPVVGATVTINELVNGVPFTKTVQTDEKGNYEIIVPTGNHEYKLLITKNIKMNGVNVPISYTQLANVGETAGQGEEIKSEKAIVGQLLVTDGANAKPQLITDVIKGATYKVTNVDKDIDVTVNDQGQYMVTGGTVGETYSIYLTVLVKDENGVQQELAGQKVDISIPEEGVVAVEATLIDPYGIVTDPSTGKPIEGVEMQLFWADTENNRKLGRTPHTLVDLPILPDFEPNQNRNTQFTNAVGEYAWMVFANGDYYIIAKKDGYVTYDSRIEKRDVGNPLVDDSYIVDGIIHVGRTIVEYDLSMTKATSSEPVANVPTPDKTKATVEKPLVKKLPKTGSMWDQTMILMVGGVLIMIGICLNVLGRRRRQM